MAEKKSVTVMLVAGEASGDRHAANLFLELKQRIPDLHGFGMGGTRMAESGIDVRYDSSNIAVIGVVEVIKHYREIRRALKQMQHLVVSERPDLLICVDYKEFNFKLARYAKQCGIKVLFYVSPQVWAWRPGRAKKYGEVIDMMAVIFPFETPYYEVHNIPVRYVGHPSVDKAHPLRTLEQDQIRFDLNPRYPVVGLLPGSRNHEIKNILPVMIQAALRIQKALPNTQFVLPQADSISDEVLRQFVDRHLLAIKIIKYEPYDVVQCCDAVMIASGTATLETALQTVPMVVVYKLSALTYLLGRCLIKSPFIGLPNIIAGKQIVRELIQHQATVENLSSEVIRLLTDQAYRKQIRYELGLVRDRLGQGGGSSRMAELVVEMLQQNMREVDEST